MCVDFLNDNYYHKLKLPPPCPPPRKGSSQIDQMKDWVEYELDHGDRCKAVRIHKASQRMEGRKIRVI